MLAGVEVALEVHTALNDTPQAQVSCLCVMAVMGTAMRMQGVYL